MSEEVPKRKISDFKIPDKAKEELQLISKITGMLAEKPEILKDIGDKMQEVSREYELKIKEEVTNVIANAIDIDRDQLIAICPDIIRYIQYWDHVWSPPRFWWWWGPYDRTRIRSRRG